MHADIVQVPGNLCVPLPDAVDFEAGAFAAVASVAMHGVRQADVRIGERVAVIGLGLVGQLTGQILRAAGCHVVGDRPRRVTRGQGTGSWGRSTSATSAQSLEPERHPSRSRRVRRGDRHRRDSARATRSSWRASLLARPGPRRRRRRRTRGRARGPRTTTARSSIRFSRSYGPGRYDREYEERGLDYPIGYVRWTEQRNMAAFLDLLAAGGWTSDGLIPERFPVERRCRAYDRLASADSIAAGRGPPVRARRSAARWRRLARARDRAQDASPTTARERRSAPAASRSGS